MRLRVPRLRTTRQGIGQNPKNEGSAFSVLLRLFRSERLLTKVISACSPNSCRLLLKGGFLCGGLLTVHQLICETRRAFCGDIPLQPCSSCSSCSGIGMPPLQEATSNSPRVTYNLHTPNQHGTRSSGPEPLERIPYFLW